MTINWDQRGLRYQIITSSNGEFVVFRPALTATSPPAWPPSPPASRTTGSSSPARPPTHCWRTAEWRISGRFLSTVSLLWKNKEQRFYLWFCLDKPVVHLSTGNNASLVRPGQDITLKCLVQSNPAYHDIVWTKGVSRSRSRKIKHELNEENVRSAGTIRELIYFT